MIWFSNDIKVGLFQFLDALVLYYPISLNRALEKFEEMYQFALRIGGNARVCPFRDLGQILDRSGKPTIPYLKMVTYMDRKSKSQWYFSYFYDEVNNNVLVYKMKFTKHVVKEDKISKIITESINTYLKRECISMQNKKCI